MGATTTTLTPADLIAMGRPPGAKHYELSSSGELIIVGNAGRRHEDTKAMTMEEITRALPRGVGRVYSETMFSVGDAARIPEVAFVSKAKLDAHPEQDGPIPFPPDLAIEVISESETADYAEEKAAEYLAGGVQEVWQMYPKRRLIRVRTSASTHDLQQNDTVSSALLPGFNVKVADVFPA